MRTRIISGAVLLALVGLVAWLRGPLLVGAILLVSGLAAGEFYGMARAGGHQPWRAGGIVLALALPAAAALSPWLPALPAGATLAQIAPLLTGARPDRLELTTLLLTGAGLLATLLWRGVTRPDLPAGLAASPAPAESAPTPSASSEPWPPAAAPLAQAPPSQVDAIPTAQTPHSALRTPHSAVAWTDVGLTVGGALYTGGILKYGLLLNGAPGEIWWILLVVLGTAATDSGAYFVGRALGRRKLIPHISPNKTWAGFWGGLACAVLAVAVFAGPMRIPAAHVLPLGVAIGLTSVVGDLTESLLKRSFGVKDSSHLIPGHGGLLDRLDSILLVLLVVYGYMHYIYQ